MKNVFVFEKIKKYDANLLPPSRKLKVEKLHNEKDKIASVFEYFFIKKKLRLKDGQDFEYTKNGRPFVSGKRDFSITNSNVLCIAIFDDGIIGGVDAELVRDYDLSFAKMICNNKEILQIENSKDKNVEFTKIFTMKESALKCLDLNINVNLKNIIQNDMKFETEIKKIAHENRFLVISKCEKKKTP